ncbi:B12-binding domain-containing radical SAM protein [Desulfatibacillum aliphaticivorans]|uniref:B12-binding domain-containing radical SAM protein n=1 Tax=Desulfatibacillum aliphaticivorans TaxID=218208 RepID=UPI0003FD2C74|nr:radical SAM protein [Desulfatibacillum aliphaticivorans]
MDPKRILLINPNWTGIQNQKQRQFKRLWPPLSLALAAAMMERQGLEVRIIDNQVKGHSPEKIGLLAEKYDRVFVTSTPYDRWQCPSLDIRFFFDTLRHISKDKLFILGSHVTERPEAILRESGARAAILGEPEQTMLDIACAENPNDLEQIPGLAWLEQGRLKKSPAGGFIKNMDALPYPAFHLLDMKAYHYFPVMGKSFGILEASRGCPGKCNFCYMGMYGRRVRRKSVDRFLDETEWAVRKIGLKNVYFMDLEFAINKRFVLEFCKGLQDRGLILNWCCQTRVTDMDEEVAQAMAQAGCSLIHFGVEAGTDRILKQTGKGILVKDCYKAVRLCKSFGIRTALFMNFGFPGEHDYEMEATIKLALNLDPDYAAFHLIVPFPGTALADNCGLNPENFPAHQYPHYNFFDHDLEKLKRMLHQAYWKFYLRPRPIFNVLGDMLKNSQNMLFK